MTGIQPRTWRLEFPPRQKLLNMNDRLHFRAKAAITRQLRGDACWLARVWKVPALRRARVDFIYEPPRRGRRDSDNWAPTVKALVDGIVDAGVLPDDDTKHLDGPYKHITDEPFPGGRVVLIITELPEEIE